MRDGSLWPLRILKTHRSLRTLLFMILSGVIVDSMYLNSDSVFWLFKPLKKYRKPNENVLTESKPTNQHHICHHRNSCESHISKVKLILIIFFLIFEFCIIIVHNILGVQNVSNAWNGIGSSQVIV